MTGNKLYEFFKKIDRSLFIDNEYKCMAYINSALPIGHEQTISQPSLVYEMTLILDLDKSLKVLEIGTGSGYQTAFLAEFVGKVYTVEVIEELSHKAMERLIKLGYDNIEFKVEDGSEGWLEYAPYDRIIVTAAAGELPKPLIDQLSPGGRMVVPVGQQGMQELLVVEKDEHGNIEQQTRGIVTFVELKGDYGWNR